MLKLLTVFFLLIFLSACGVDTSSSSKDGNNGSSYQPQIDTGTGTGDGNTTAGDGNSTTGDGNSTTGGGTTIDSEFDTVGAEYDANACNANFYSIARDASYYGDSKGENGSDFFSVIGQGLEIRSEYLNGEATNDNKTWVTLFYKSFPDSKHFNLQGYTSYSMEGVFILSYDIAWSDESISGMDNTMYVQSVKDTKPTCYRLGLNSVIGTQIDVQKVYR